GSGGRRIDLVAGERPRLTERRRPPDEVENDRRIAKEIADGLRRFDAAGEGCAAKQRRGSERAPFSAFTVAPRAFLGEDAGALRRRPAAGRTAGAVRNDGHVPGLDIRLGDRFSEPRRLGERRTRSE